MSLEEIPRMAGVREQYDTELEVRIWPDGELRAIWIGEK